MRIMSTAGIINAPRCLNIEERLKLLRFVIRLNEQNDLMDSYRNYIRYEQKQKKPRSQR